MALIEPGIYFSCVEFCSLDGSEAPMMSFLQIYFGEEFYFDYDSKTVTRKSTNESHDIFQWDPDGIKFERFKL